MIKAEVRNMVGHGPQVVVYDTLGNPTYAVLEDWQARELADELNLAALKIEKGIWENEAN